MIIKALCDYYDMLAEKGKVLPPGYSKVGIRYKVALTEEGKIDALIPYQEEVEVSAGKGKDGTPKFKTKYMPKQEVMPKRTEKPGIDANFIEHRPAYLFGLVLDGESLTSEDRTGKAKKSHEVFVKENLDFIEGLDSPVINAYRNFILNWKPEAERENKKLLNLGKNYGTSGFIFCLSGSPDKLLHNDVMIKERWEREFAMRSEEADENERISQCAITGEEAPIAKIHSKIKGVYGGSAFGNVLIGFNNPSDSSYCNEQSYNSNISKEAMMKYTEALNYILASDKHKMALDDMTVIFWAMDPSEVHEDFFLAMATDSTDNISSETAEEAIREILERGKGGVLAKGELQNIENVDFYMAGLKPNTSRIAVKFIVRKKYADVLWNIAKFQESLQTSPNFIPVYLSRIKKELISPKSKNEKVNPALMSKIFEAMIQGTPLPEALLSTIVRRVRTDSDDDKKGVKKLNYVRAGIIRACVNGKYKREELKVILDKENKSTAYLCGRLFAVLEHAQLKAAGSPLNRTIKDGYFSSAASKPAMVFPKLIMLYQNHLKKISLQEAGGKKKAEDINRTVMEVMGKLQDSFPESLNLSEQGEFIIGYYKQAQRLFWKAENSQQEQQVSEQL